MRVVGIQPKETANILPAEYAGRCLQQRCGSNGLQVRSDGESFGRRFQS